MYKSKLQELCHRYAWNLPEYAAEKDGPDHNPRFTATVTVNGVSFELPKDQCCRSTKEAQNLAAHLAFYHFTNSPPPPPPPPPSGASTSNCKVAVRPPNMDTVQQRRNNIGKLSGVCEAPLAGGDDNISKVCGSYNFIHAAGVLHLYKNRLQHFAQKKNITIPSYSSELDGPPHARRFRSNVTVDGKTYETQEFFSTLKEAEHAAAKVAFESLALNDIQEDEGLHKTLLQELAQKKGLLFPVYDTARTGAPHTPIFRSTVEVGSGTFQGQEAKTKKQAEMNAAKIAYSALMKCGQLDEPLNVPSASSGYAAADVSEPGVRQKPKLTIEEVKQKEEAGTNAKRNRCSSAQKTYSIIRDPSPAAFCLPDSQSSTSAVLDHPTESTRESGTYAGSSILPREKIFIFPRNASVELPNGASVMACSDENWVAASLELNPNQ